MDEILFENRYHDSEPFLTQVSRMIPGALRSILLVIITLYSILMLWLQYWDSLIIMLAITLWFSFQPRLAARSYLRKQRQFYDGQIPPYVLHFTADRIICNKGDTRLEYPYHKLTKVKASGNLMILMADRRAYVTLCRDSFTKGTYEAFLRFLAEKCPNLKLPKSIQNEV